MPVILTEKAFETLCQIVDPRLLDDPRFNHRVAARETHGRASRRDRGVDVAAQRASVPGHVDGSRRTVCALCEPSKTCSTTPHLNARGSFARLDDSSGSFVVNNAPFQFRDSDTAIRGGAPQLGEHTTSILTDLLGLDPQRVQTLVADGVVSRSSQGHRTGI